MNDQEAQSKLAFVISHLCSNVKKAHFWKLTGNDANSLCRLLCLSEDEMRTMLRFCKVCINEEDNVSRKNFELLMIRCNTDYTSYRPFKSKKEWYIKVGKGDVVLPKDMYSTEEELKASAYPIEDEHFAIALLRTKSQRCPLTDILSAANVSIREVSVESNRKSNNKQKAIDSSPKSLIISYVKELITSAAASANGCLTARSERKLKRTVDAAVDITAKELLQSVIEKYAMQLEDLVRDERAKIFSPESNNASSSFERPSVPETPNVSSTVSVSTVFLPPAKVSPTELRLFQAEEITVSDDDEVEMSSADEFLLELKDEVLLQTFLYRRIHEKKEFFK